MTVLKVIGCFILFFVVVFAIGFMAQGTDFVLYKIFAPARANVERQVFENTKSYNQGNIQTLRDYQKQYILADETQKSSLASVIVHEFADFPDEKLPTDLQPFMSEVRSRNNSIQLPAATSAPVSKSKLKPTSGF